VLRGGYATTLITDSVAAKGLLAKAFSGRAAMQDEVRQHCAEDKEFRSR
jgi:hypothetical protein